MCILYGRYSVAEDAKAQDRQGICFGQEETSGKIECFRRRKIAIEKVYITLVITDLLMHLLILNYISGVVKVKFIK
jgi:hypothetical protein